MLSLAFGSSPWWELQKVGRKATEKERGKITNQLHRQQNMEAQEICNAADFDKQEKM